MAPAPSFTSLGQAFLDSPKPCSRNPSPATSAVHPLDWRRQLCRYAVKVPCQLNQPVQNLSSTRNGYSARSGAPFDIRSPNINDNDLWPSFLKTNPRTEPTLYMSSCVRFPDRSSNLFPLEGERRRVITKVCAFVRQLRRSFTSSAIAAPSCSL